MNKFFTVIYYFTFCLLLVGCSGSSNSLHNKIVINKGDINVQIMPNDDTLKLSSISNNYNLIELTGKMINDISDVIIIDSLIVVKSKSEGEDVHLFDYDGQYISSFVKLGRGSGEVLTVESVKYNKFANTIDVLCNYGQEIYQYNLSGILEDKFNVPPPISYVGDFEILEPNVYIYYKNLGELDSDDQQFRLYVYDYNKNEVLNKFIPFDPNLEEKISIGQKNNLYRANDKIYFYESFQNGIYECDINNISPYLCFKKNKFSYPIEDIYKYKDELDFINNSNESSYIWAHRNCVDYNNYIFSYFTYLKKVYLNVVSLKDKQAKTYSYINDDIVSGKVFRSNVFEFVNSSSGNLICSYWDADVLDPDKTFLLILQRCL